MLASDIHQPQMFQGPTAQESRVSHPAAIAQGKLLLIGLMADAQLQADHIAMIDTTGTHTVEYYIGGKHFTGTCERESNLTTIKFLDDEGNEVQFQPGKTYIALPNTPREVKNIA